MPSETVPRRWTIATWLVAHVAADIGAVVRALDGVQADAYALQSIRESAAKEIAAALGVHHAWELSYYPTSRLMPGSGTGLAVFSPHAIRDSTSVVTNEHASTWSKHRRIAQFATVERSDHSGYTIVHAVGPKHDVGPTGPAPMIRIRPEQVGADDTRAVELPVGVIVVGIDTSRPIDGGAHLMVVTFDMAWVQGDFPGA